MRQVRRRGPDRSRTLAMRTSERRALVEHGSKMVKALLAGCMGADRPFGHLEKMQGEQPLY